MGRSRSVQLLVAMADGAEPLRSLAGVEAELGGCGAGVDNKNAATWRHALIAACFFIRQGTPHSDHEFIAQADKVQGRPSQVNGVSLGGLLGCVAG